MDFRRRVREHLPPLRVAREPEIVDELAQHLQDLYEEAIASGLPHDDALALALAALPGEATVLARDLETVGRSMPGLIVDRWQQAGDLPTSRGRLHMLTDLTRDLRYAVRMLVSAPTFTAIVVATLALGVGANAVIFTAVDAILLHTAGVSDPATLVSVYNASTDGQQRFSVVSFPDYADLRDASIYQDVAAYGGGSVATGMRAARWRRAFVVFQVAMSLMLLVGAGLFLRTLRNANAIDLGYRIDSTLVADVNLDVRGYSQEAGQNVYRQILERLRSAIPWRSCRRSGLPCTTSIRGSRWDGHSV